MSELTSLEQRALAELSACTDETALRAWNTRYFGKQGEVLAAVKRVGAIPPAERKAYGQQANQVKETLTRASEEKNAGIKKQELERSLTGPAPDVTLPGRPAPHGRLHLSTQTLRRIYAVFADLGFQVYRTREVED